MYWLEERRSTCTDEWWAEAAQEGLEDGLGVPEEDRGLLRPPACRQAQG